MPRPCFFDGQAIAADDLNAIVGYAQNQSGILSRLLGGWGILGGLKVDAPDPLRRVQLGASQALRTLSPNPQVLAGTKITVSPGVAIDSLGRKLTLCDAVTLDVQDLVKNGPGQLISEACASLIPGCTAELVVTGTRYYLVAEAVEKPTRPAPQFSGGGPCDPAPSCEFSRKQEEVRFSLVPSIPEEYQFTGCLQPTGFDIPAAPGGQVDPDLCRDEVFAFIDNVQGQLAALCSASPAVVLAELIVTPGDNAFPQLPLTPRRTFVLDSYPCRKLTFQVGLLTRFFPNLVCPPGAADPQ